WGGVEMDDPASCESYLQRKLIRPLGVTADRYAGFQSNAAQPEEECERISQWLARAGPVDVCLLGLGANGHIAFNEPGRSLRPGPHLARLTASTLRHPMLLSARALPSYG